jgi:MYXO-CTERM domain-containing protein
MFRRAPHACLSALITALLLSFTAARADALTQPGGSDLLPRLNPNAQCGTSNVQACLDTEEGGRTFEAQETGFLEPETYDPSCNLTFKVLARGGGFRSVFGWYNVKIEDGKAVRPDKHYVFLECTDSVGVERALDLAEDPRYEGGLIGFFMASPENPQSSGNQLPGNCPQFAADGTSPSGVGYIYYSQRELNPDNTGPMSYIHLITWQSDTSKDSFYFGWEDLFSGGDNDFDDLLTKVTGIACSGGGEPCQTGQQGICADGRTQCTSGKLTCVPDQVAGAESCNALDDDCNGQVDDGDLCDAGFVCDRGQCVPNCAGNEFPCSSPLVCNSRGLCVDPACEAVECPAGQICRAGECTNACTGVTCPFGTVCRNGACLDPCATIQCDDGFSCNLGVCVDCSCKGCDVNEVCGAQNICVPSVCESMSCDAGQHCVEQGGNGVCLSNCEGAVCPRGQTCSEVSGVCEGTILPPDAGGSGGDAGGGIVIGNGATGNGATGNGSGTGGSSGNGSGDGEDDGEGEDDGCGCRVAGANSGSLAAGWLAAIALGAAMARRRRRN